ncbi:endogenous retrovirus group K member 6 Env polyprotein-like isoform X2 [Talpa occidentalis]|nr:endogenous retrovirus group K member 6 Env polyprotein-like isoform X2 [Talpa occidentalis]
MHRCSPLGHHPPPPRCHRSRSPVGRLSSSLHHLRVRKTSYHDNWNLLKNLASNSEQLLMQQNARITLETMFLAVLAIFSYSISPASPASLMPSVSYWAYIPDPPFLHPTPWGFPSPRVFTNYSDLLGGDSDSFVLFKSTNNFSFQGHMDSPPMCFTSNPVHMKSQLPGCLPINDKYFLTVTSKPSSSGPNRDLWFLEQLHLPLMSPRIVGFFCRTRSSTTGQIASSHPLNLSLDGIQRDGLLPPTSSTLRMVPVHTRTYFASLPPLHLCFFADLDILFMLSPCGLVWAPLMPSSLRAPDI